MPNPFHPDDFPINEDWEFTPTRTLFLRGTIHFKKDAHIHDLTGKLSQPFSDFSSAFCQNASKTATKLDDDDSVSPAFSIGSIGDMMRTLKTIKDSSGEKVCDLNITFVSFDNSSVRFPPGSEHSRHEIELWPVDDRADNSSKHEGFVRHSVPYFWDMTQGDVGVLYKAHNQERIEVAQVAAYGTKGDAILVVDDGEVDAVVAMSTCVILLNGRDAMDA